ncbi:hypothetical protein [Alteriqipengyuania lutimaris]|uniref:Uncharacterized protein n=1 Tax=Alteriqipengyuania lutimaris TaxID=1538146 RepID=A0A395LU68_9SPHN|nr:hypothetical protein [Alteriqipengyuania lutimaris]MBB3032892.1 glucan phosphoethanolaminetransferase (alkaline phosphatase superfamily) [Alteriqipengyuania lutimaris]RDS78020.1 hypothetical protein DL238_10695 [Alteriqipengyuania lutimaris]
MTEFEFIFALYALALGLSLVEVLSGLGRTLELRFASDAGGDQFTIGWLTPLLAIFVILDLLSFWMFSWSVQNFVSVTSSTLLAVVVFASAYYLAARLVFPSDPDRFTSLDTHYFRVCRTVMGMLIALVVVQWVYLLSLPQVREQLLSPLTIGPTVLFVAMMAILIVSRSRRVHAVVLVALSVRYLVLYLQ